MIWTASNDPQDLHVAIADSALEEMRQLAMGALPNEVGGMLVGMYHGTFSVCVTDVIPFPPGEAFTFDRPASPPEVIQQLRDFFDGEPSKFYVGEWHTHPMSSPEPSPLDLQSLRELAEDPNAKCPCPLLLILGGQDSLSLTCHFCDETIQFEVGG